MILSCIFYFNAIAPWTGSLDSIGPLDSLGLLGSIDVSNSFGVLFSLCAIQCSAFHFALRNPNQFLLFIRMSNKACIVLYYLLGYSYGSVAVLVYLIGWIHEITMLLHNTMRLDVVVKKRDEEQAVAANYGKAFLEKDDCCGICLDEFEPQAVDLVSAYNDDMGLKHSRELGPALRNLNPPILLLRCGHVLHLDCGKNIFRSNPEDFSRHHRCPFCKTPLTKAGEASGALFS